MLQCVSKLSYSSPKEISSSQMGEMVYLYSPITQTGGVLYLNSAPAWFLHCIVTCPFMYQTFKGKQFTTTRKYSNGTFPACWLSKQIKHCNCVFHFQINSFGLQLMFTFCYMVSLYESETFKQNLNQ